MAQKTTVELIDDLDGESTADKSVTVGLDGKWWKLDLTSAHIDELHEVISPYIAHGEAVKVKDNGKPAKRTTVDREELRAIRDWARSHGHKVADRGRIPAEIVDAYRSA